MKPLCFPVFPKARSRTVDPEVAGSSPVALAGFPRHFFPSIAVKSLRGMGFRQLPSQTLHRPGSANQCSRVRSGATRSCIRHYTRVTCFRPVSFAGEVGKSANRVSQVGQRAVGVPGRQFRLAVSGQELGRPQVHPAPPEQRQVRVPQGVEVRVQRTVRAGDRVGDAGRRQVAPDHLRPALARRPRAAPHGVTARPAVEVDPQQLGRVRGDGLDLGLPRLVEPGRQGDRRRRGGQVEVGGRQVGQGSRPEAGGGGGQVQVEPVLARQSAEPPRTGPGRGEQGAEFVGGQFAPTPADVELRVQQ